MSIKVVILGAGGLVGARMMDALMGMSEFGTGGSETLPLAKRLCSFRHVRDPGQPTDLP